MTITVLATLTYDARNKLPTLPSPVHAEFEQRFRRWAQENYGCDIISEHDMAWLISHELTFEVVDVRIAGLTTHRQPFSIPADERLPLPASFNNIPAERDDIPF